MDKVIYEIEAELGRLNVNTYRVTKRSRTVFNSRVELFPKKSQTEKYHSACYDSLMFRLSSNIASYRISEEILNRIRWQNDEKTIHHRSLADTVEREGNKLINYIEIKTNNILKENGFNKTTGVPEDITAINKCMITPDIPIISQDTVNQIIDEYNDGKDKNTQISICELHEVFVDDKHSVNISVDDINTLKQKENGRMKNSPEKEKRSYVKNTVVHIQSGLEKYILDGLGIRKMLKVLAGFLLYNNLLNNKFLIFFTDGADDIKTAIKDVYSWRNYRIILDWYHLKKKCQERLSMAMKGREFRNEALKEVLILLWRGKVDLAVEYLKKIDKVRIKNPNEISKLIAYFDRNWSYIPCYALRQRLNLRISSNRGEKANDLVVAKRQKHNGMSWSKYGSSGLANINTMFLNKEDVNWINSRQLNFKLVPTTNKHVS